VVSRVVQVDHGLVEVRAQLLLKLGKQGDDEMHEAVLVCLPITELEAFEAISRHGSNATDAVAGLKLLEDQFLSSRSEAVLLALVASESALVYEYEIEFILQRLPDGFCHTSLVSHELDLGDVWAHG